ncbi:MAG: hypothetical protein RQM92_04885 [Candidatus Syntrophopropionicum ammoniitolerans]
MKRKKQLSTDKGFYVPNEEILALAEQLEGKCSYAQTGMEWIDRAAPGKGEAPTADAFSAFFCDCGW